MPAGGSRADDTTGDLELLFDQAQVPLLATDAEGTITRWNDSAASLFGHPKEVAIGEDVRGLIVPATDRHRFESALGSAFRGESGELDARIAQEDGGGLYVHISLSPLIDASGDVTGCAVVTFDLTDRVRAEQRLAVTYDITRILGRADHIYEAAPLILEAVCRNLEWSVGALWATDGVTDELRCLDVWSTGEPQLNRFAEMTRWLTIRKGQVLPGRVWATRSSVWIPDVARDQSYTRHEAAAEAELRGAFAFPMMLRGDVLGVMEFYSRDVRQPDEPLVQMMYASGGQLGQFMDRKQAERDRRMSEARKTAVVASAMDGIITIDHLGYVLEFNPAAEEIFGYQRDEVIGKEMAELIIPERMRDQHRNGLLQYLETGEGPVVGRRVELTAMRADGTEFPVEIAVTRVDIPGAPLFTGYLSDITERKELEQERTRLLRSEQLARERAERVSLQLSQLQRITDAALASLSIGELLDELLHRITEILQSEVAAILMGVEDSDFLTARSAIGLGKKLADIPPVPRGEQVPGIVAETGKSMIIGDLGTSDIDAPVLHDAGMRSVMAVPLVLESRTIGVLVAASSDPDHFTEEDLTLLRLAADRIAAPIQNASLYQREHRIATTLQRSLLPSKIPETPGIEIVERYVAGGEGLEVGGDWYDVMPLPDGKVGMVIGDVVGKGIRAAALMGQMRNSLRAFAIEGHGVPEVVTRINRLTESVERDTMVATLIYLIYDPATRSATFCTAGHPPPLLQEPTGEARFIGTERNIPLGVIGDFEYGAETIEIPPGSRVLLYTDGLIEDPASSIEAGLDRLRLAAESAPEELEAFADHVLEQIFSQIDHTDDVALLAIRPLH